MLHEPIGPLDRVGDLAPRGGWRLGPAACVALILTAACPLSQAVRADTRVVADTTAASVAAAMADPSRPASDTTRDLDRKPAQTLAFAGVKPGYKIGDYAAGAGYFTRLFAGVVGPAGHVYASVPSGLFQYPNIVKGIADIETYTVTHPNVTVTFASALDAARYPEKLDVFWISQNYHDLHDSFMGPVNMAAFNRTVYAALKPGGIYLVLDHTAVKGSPPDVTDTLHRIEPSTVRREVEAAGFKFEAESALLANPGDPHTAGVFDPSIRGKTDQFILKFRRP
jgi:predicted methyltransferase